jgi:hypothetical protein
MENDSCEAAKLGVIPVATDSDVDTAPLAMIFPAPLEAVPIATRVMVFDPLVA